MIDVVGAAIIRGSCVLAAQRSEWMSTPLKWEFPGGKVEAGETHAQALERELDEELGLKISVGDFVATGYSQTGNRIIALHIYKASILEGTPTAREHRQLAWVEIREMDKLDWADADKPACDLLMGKDQTGTQPTGTGRPSCDAPGMDYR